MKKRDENGSITLEASLILTMFIMGYMCIISLVQLVEAQAVMQYVIDQTALEISKSSYILDKTGIIDQLMKTSAQSNKFKKDTAQVVSDVTDFFSDFGDLKNSTINTVEMNANKAIGSFNTAQSSVADYFSDPEALWKNIMNLFKATGEKMVEDTLVKSMVESRLKKQISLITNKDIDDYLAGLGIQNGMKGIHLKVEWMQQNAQETAGIRIEATYEVELPWAYFHIKDMRYKVSAYTALW